MVMSRPKLFVLTGPTAVGKTELSLQMAEFLHCPIISADSRQMFADLPIGTAAPTAAQLARVPHHFVGNLALTDYYSAARFEEEATVFLAKLGTLDGALGALTGLTLVSSTGVWGFTLERHIFASSMLLCQTPCCLITPLLPSVMQLQHVMEYCWEGSTSTAISLALTSLALTCRGPM